ncbi:MAG: pyruvate dehydrogenase complex dihydrolipoamide acetyltransferase [Wolbachia endosymbiont of Meromenopon meropis]|nr:pyruvate dehydrogenase complex dihydrolipoamide acetyltransferase [Wolbachia endosymbiont of Meromenopon meropis]
MPTIEILMPALSPTMNKTGGKIVKWCKKEQDKVSVGDVIAEIETDKAVMEFESVNDGILVKILVPEGVSGVPINQPIALMLEEGGDDSNTIDLHLNDDADLEIKKEAEKCSFLTKSDFSVSSNSSLSHHLASFESRKEEDCGIIKNKIKISPLARKIAKSKNLDIMGLKGTGPYGRIIKDDVLEFLERDVRTENRKRSNKDVIVEVSNMRQVIAQRLVESKQSAPHFYLTVDCYVDKLISLKNEINSVSEDNRVTINDLIVKAVAFSIKKFPNINSSWIDGKILKYADVDISIAVALEDGLITPIIKNADRKSILCISKEIKDLVSRARSGKLKSEEFQGGGFTVSNLGMFGIKTFSAIINPPQSCIMAIGASKKQPVVIKDKIEIVETIMVTLSVDHRTIDGVLGSSFLNLFKYYIENPLTVLLERA